MASKLTAFVFMLMVSFYSVSGQSISDFKKMFGKPKGTYPIFTISENISMKPDFNKSGQVCRLGLFTNKVSPDLKPLPKAVPFEDFKSIVDRIIPLDKRGAKGKQFDTGWTIGGRSTWAVFSYEEVSLVYSATIDNINFKICSEDIKECDLSNLSEPEKTVQTAVPKGDFDNYKSSLVEQVEIRWKKRTCD
jgi:hypothetical protein